MQAPSFCSVVVIATRDRPSAGAQLLWSIGLYESLTEQLLDRSRER